MLVHLHIAALAALAASSAWAKQAEEKWYNPNGVNPELKKLTKIVLFMQENRAFDHYFGTMPGVRGFQDPNVMVSNNTGKTVFHQPVDDSILIPAPPKHVKEIKPFYLNWAGAEWNDKTQCMVAGTNSWQANHAAWNKGNNDHWALGNNVYSLGYYHKDDIPIQYELADKFTVGDMYFESVIASTIPNRVSWWTGTINPPHGSEVPGPNVLRGGPVVDNDVIPGCKPASGGGLYTCVPFDWKTTAEYLQERDISWRVYQDIDNFFDDTLYYFKKFQAAALKGEEMAERGLTFPGLERFYEDARTGNLPDVSYIMAPTNLVEHPPMRPQDGGWLQKEVANAVMNGKDWNSTALIFSYDETGGWADHVMAPHAPQSVKSEWMTDPFDKKLGNQPIGPGYRLPFYIISPYTQGGHVFTEHTTHESQIMFLEKWAEAHGKPFYTKEIPKWRREQYSDLVKAFDFSKKESKVVPLPQIPDASKDLLTGLYNGGIKCLARNLGQRPPVPYERQDESNTLETTKGFKPVRGDLTEGRRMTVEAHGRALSHANAKLGTSRSNIDHDGDDQLFVLQWLGTAPKDNRFHITTEKGHYITKDLSLSGNKHEAGVFSIKDMGNGVGYKVTELHAHKQLSIQKNGEVSYGDASYLKIYSVTR